MLPLPLVLRAPLNGRIVVAQDAGELADLDTDEQLLEFLEADLLPEAANPQFKAQLREYLRAILFAEGRLRASPRDDQT